MPATAEHHGVLHRPAGLDAVSALRTRPGLPPAPPAGRDGARRPAGRSTQARPTRPVPDAAVHAFARDWAVAILGTSYLPMGYGEFEAMLRGLARRLVDSVIAEPFTTAPAAEVGAALVRARCTGAETLRRTIEVVGRALPHHLGLPAMAVPGGADDDPSDCVDLLDCAGPPVTTCLDGAPVRRARVAPADLAGLTDLDAVGETDGIAGFDAVADLDRLAGRDDAAGVDDDLAEFAGLTDITGLDLVEDLPAAGAPGSWLPALQGALAGGYAAELRALTRAEQETVSQAAFGARVEAERALADSEARFRAIFAGTAVAIVISGPDGRIVEANESMSRLLGRPVARLRGRSLAEFAHPADAPAVLAAYAGLAASDESDAAGEVRGAGSRGGGGGRGGGSRGGGAARRAGERQVRLEQRFLRRGGETIWVDLSVSRVRHAAGRYDLAVVTDVTDRHRLRARLRQAATHDPLTRLPNRAVLSDRLAGLLAGAAARERIGVCILDIDRFEAVNEKVGHDAGDRLLAVTADRLGRCAAGAGRVVARMDGDRFVFVLPCTSAREMTTLAERAVAEVSAPVRVGRHVLAVTASAGVVERPAAGATPAELIRCAGAALRWAKASGRGSVALFETERDASELARHTLSATLEDGLARREFLLEYQPMVSLADGRLAGAEALIRWQHPAYGRLAPDSFIGLAEEADVIVPLGRWVLEESCRAAAGWQDLVPDGPVVSVNIAARQAADAGLVADVARALDAAGLAPDRLQLELTERAVLSTAAEPLAALRTLADMGVRIAIDDFGTGYSNLAYLRTLPVTELKLAGPFVEGLRAPGGEPGPAGTKRGSQPDERIVAAVVQLAHTLGLTVTAEGVETAGQAERLRAMGCDTGQGLYFAGAAGPAEITRALAGRPLGG